MFKKNENMFKILLRESTITIYNIIANVNAPQKRRYRLLLIFKILIIRNRFSYTEQNERVSLYAA